MKRKTMAVLLVVCLILTISGTAMAQVMPRSDPNECLFCGYGSTKTIVVWDGVPFEDPNRENTACMHGSPLYHKDIYMCEQGKQYSKYCEVCGKYQYSRTIFRYWVECTYTGNTYPA